MEYVPVLSPTQAPSTRWESLVVRILLLFVTFCLLFATMDSLSGTLWDVIISGTGLQQSLLAL